MKKFFAILPLIISISIPTLFAVFNQYCRSTGFFIGIFIACIITSYGIYITIIIHQEGSSWTEINDDYQHKQKLEQERIQKENANNIPKCPTCGSTNIRRISGSEKVVNAAAFGLLGNKRKCQFECQNPNCRYRW